MRADFMIIMIIVCADPKKELLVIRPEIHRHEFRVEIKFTVYASRTGDSYMMCAN
jgi:hypothetical protein